MTHDQQRTILVALAVYAEDSKYGMRVFAGEEIKAYYKRELDRIQEARTAVEAMEADFDADFDIELEGGKADGPGSGEQEGAHNGPASLGADGPDGCLLPGPQEPRGL